MLENKAAFFWLNDKFARSRHAFLYDINPDSPAKRNPNLPFFFVFQGFQSLAESVDAHLVLPGCSMFEQATFFCDLFGRSHQLHPVIPKLLFAVEDWRIVLNVYAILSNFQLPIDGGTNKVLRELLESTTPISSVVPTLITKPTPLFTTPVQFFNSVLVSAVGAYLLSDSSSQLSKNLAVLHEFFAKYNEL